MDRETQQPARVALRYNTTALAYLKHMQDRWYRNQDVFGDTYNASLVRLVLIGWMEGRLADFTSLGNDLRVSRQQAARRCLSMSEAGWIEYKRKVGRIAVKPTDKLIAYAEVEIPRRLRLVIPMWQKIAMLAGVSIALSVTPQLASTEAGSEQAPRPAVVCEVVAIEVLKRSESLML